MTLPPKIKHLVMPGAGNEFSFCGLAFDAHGSGDHDTDDLFIEGPTTHTINCPQCCETVAAIRAAIKGVTFRAAKVVE